MRTGGDRAPVSTTSRPLISGPPGLSVSFVTKDKRRSQAGSWGRREGGTGGGEPEDEAQLLDQEAKRPFVCPGLAPTQRHPRQEACFAPKHDQCHLLLLLFFFFFFFFGCPRFLSLHGFFLLLFIFLCVVFLSAQSPTSLALLLTASLLLPFHPFSSSSSSTPCPPFSRAIRQTAGPRAASALSDRPKKR